MIYKTSTQILDAAQQIQALADAGKVFKPFFSPGIRETVDGVDKIANAMNATGEALRYIGFDEAEPDSITGAGHAMGPALSMGPQFDVGDNPVMETSKTATKLAIKTLDKGLQGPARVAVSLPGVIIGYADKEKISKSPIEEIKNSEDKTKAIAYHALSPLTTTEEVLLHKAHKTWHDPNAQVQEKIIATANHLIVSVANKTVLAPVALVEQGFRWITSWFDEDEGYEGDRQAFASSAERRAAIFGSAPETLASIDFIPSVVTYAYQKNAAISTIDGQMNKGTDPFQAQLDPFQPQDDIYAVLA